MPYRVITISRQYGCGARVIGRQLAERLGIAYYDKDLIRMIADESGYATDYIEEQSDYASTSDLVFIPMSHVAPISVPMTSLIDTPQVASYLNDLIIRLAEEYPCVMYRRVYIHCFRGEMRSVRRRLSRVLSRLIGLGARVISR